MQTIDKTLHNLQYLVAMDYGHHLENMNTGSIARSAKRRYLIYSEADFEVFRPAGATRYTDRGEIWRGGGDLWSPPPRQIAGPLLHAKFHPIGATIRE